MTDELNLIDRLKKFPEVIEHNDYLERQMYLKNICADYLRNLDKFSVDDSTKIISGLDVAVTLYSTAIKIHLMQEK
ncbi:MAG: hypothetical protein WC758_01160 [Candidatus Woesearchaeota archaeon]